MRIAPDEDVRTTYVGNGHKREPTHSPLRVATDAVNTSVAALGDEWFDHEKMEKIMMVVETLRKNLVQKCVTSGHLFKLIDTDGDDCITPKEFQAGIAMSGIRPVPSTEDIRLMFRAIDGDGDGALSRVEIERSILSGDSYIQIRAPPVVDTREINVDDDVFMTQTEVRTPTPKASTKGSQRHRQSHDEEEDAEARRQRRREEKEAEKNKDAVANDYYTYNGEWFNGLRHGIGDCAWNDGDSFKGEWFMDMMLKVPTLTLIRIEPCTLHFTSN